MAVKFAFSSAAPPALQIDLSLKAGEITALIGPSGAGKTTCLRALAGLVRLEGGYSASDKQVWQDGNQFMPPWQRNIGFMAQDAQLFPHMNMVQNIAAGDTEGTRAQRLARAHDGLDKMGIGKLATRKPHQVSGGQRQRVAFLRALARKPDLLLLDEPFAAIDYPTRLILYRQIIESGRATPILLVTHDLEEAQRLASRLVVIDQGQIVTMGKPAEILMHSRAARLVGLREIGTLISAELTGHDSKWGLSHMKTMAGILTLPHFEAPLGSHVKIRILAHDVLLAKKAPQGLSAQNMLKVTVKDILVGQAPIDQVPAYQAPPNQAPPKQLSGALVELSLGDGNSDETLFARITRKAANDLDLAKGQKLLVLIKSMAIAREMIM